MAEALQASIWWVVLIEPIHDRNNQMNSWSDGRDAESRRCVGSDKLT